MTTPLFVVVGNANQGKSSVVAALTEDEAVPIDRFPGTTQRCVEYVFRVGDQPLFRIVDTPGFQRARQVLAWLVARAGNPAERPAAVRAFLAEHAATGAFPDEIELLRPIMDGAGILYVIDTSSQVEPSNEAEMEILRWTGQPAMALCNRVRARDNAEAWLPVLRQFFHIVREFNAHRARFPDRVALLRGFREIRPEWSAPIDAAVAAMEDEWQQRARRSVTALADLLVAALGHVERQPLPDGVDETKLRVDLDAAYRQAQRQYEAATRNQVEAIYRHPGLGTGDAELDLLSADLFCETTWRVFGLSRGQLLRYGALGGALVGGTIDLAVGGLSFLAGTAIGAIAGAALGWMAGVQIASIWSSGSRLSRSLFPCDTGRFLAMGPVTSPRYPWVLLDRALVHFRAVRDRSHARRDALVAIEAGAGVVAEVPESLRDPLDAALRQVLRDVGAGGTVAETTRREIEKRLGGVMSQLASRERSAD